MRDAVYAFLRCFGTHHHDSWCKFSSSESHFIVYMRNILVKNWFRHHLIVVRRWRVANCSNCNFILVSLVIGGYWLMFDTYLCRISNWILRCKLSGIRLVQHTCAEKFSFQLRPCLLSAIQLIASKVWNSIRIEGIRRALKLREIESAI